tara:strand:- start:2987 stop:3208 length:222 start_codon:yes stop_codon:yes gene_type:complete
MQKSKKITHDIELIVVDDLLKFVAKTNRGGEYLSGYDLSARIFSDGAMFISDRDVHPALADLADKEIITLDTF